MNFRKINSLKHKDSVQDNSEFVPDFGMLQKCTKCKYQYITVL